MHSKKDKIAWLFFGLMMLVSLIFGYMASLSLKRAVVMVEWSTASELNVAGFNLYRAQSPNGPFTQINAELIPASPDPLVGGSYKYEDQQVEPGEVYYYQLGDVENNGNVSRHEPIKVKALSKGKDVAIMSAGFTLAGVLGFILLKR